MHIIPTPRELYRATENVASRVRHGHLADVRPQPSKLIHESPQCTVRRYEPNGRRARAVDPVLLVPPLAAPAFVFDLRRGCSYAEHLRETGRPSYLVDYGSIAFGDRRLGLEHWVRGVVPRALKAVSADAGGRDVHLVGWCLGGIFCALAAAANRGLPIASLTLIASPFNTRMVPMFAPLRPFINAAGGSFGTALYRALGVAPAPVVKRVYQLMSLDKYITRPLVTLHSLDDRDFLEQIEAVDRMINNMHAYPGRSFGQIYHDILRTNTLADGTINLAGRTIDVRKLKLPLLSIAGEDDGIAPCRAVHHIGNLVPQARLETAPGGHLGVLTGRRARDTTWRIVDDFLDGV